MLKDIEINPIGSKLATLWFFLGAVALIGLFTYFIYGFHAYGFVHYLNIPNYWGFPLLFAAFSLRAREKDGWWLGMILGGYFLISGAYTSAESLFSLFSGDISPYSFDAKPLIRIVFGTVSVSLLAQKRVMREFRIEYATTLHRNLVLIASAGFSQALLSTQLIILFIYLRLSFLSNPFGSKNTLSVYDMAYLPELAAVSFFFIGAHLLREKKRAYDAALVLWSIVAVWGVVSIAEAVTYFVEFAQIGLVPSFINPRGIFSAIFGSLFVWWLLKSETFDLFGFEPHVRRKKALLSISTMIFFGITISLAKFVSIPILEWVFLA